MLSNPYMILFDSVCAPGILRKLTASSLLEGSKGYILQCSVAQGACPTKLLLIWSVRFCLKFGRRNFYGRKQRQYAAFTPSGRSAKRFSDDISQFEA